MQSSQLSDARGEANGIEREKTCFTFFTRKVQRCVAASFVYDKIVVISFRLPPEAHSRSGGFLFFFFFFVPSRHSLHSRRSHESAFTAYLRGEGRGICKGTARLSFPLPDGSRERINPRSMSTADRQLDPWRDVKENDSWASGVKGVPVVARFSSSRKSSLQKALIKLRQVIPDVAATSRGYPACVNFNNNRRTLASTNAGGVVLNLKPVARD